jgi:hypothetical protein
VRRWARQQRQDIELGIGQPGDPVDQDAHVEPSPPPTPLGNNSPDGSIHGRVDQELVQEPENEAQVYQRIREPPRPRMSMSFSETSSSGGSPSTGPPITLPGVPNSGIGSGSR